MRQGEMRSAQTQAQVRRRKNLFTMGSSDAEWWTEKSEKTHWEFNAMHATNSTRFCYILTANASRSLHCPFSPVKSTRRTLWRWSTLVIAHGNASQIATASSRFTFERDHYRKAAQLCTILAGQPDTPTVFRPHFSHYSRATDVLEPGWTPRAARTANPGIYQDRGLRRFALRHRQCRPSHL